MNTFGEYTMNMFDYLKNHYGDDFLGYCIYGDTHGVIEGRIDFQPFQITIWKNDVKVEFNSHMPRLYYDLPNVVGEFLGDNVSCRGDHYSSYENNHSCYLFSLRRSVVPDTPRLLKFTIGRRS